MSVFFAVDTSNYTTSTALYDHASGDLRQCKRLLPVRQGAIGQRQSEAVFGHVKALGDIVEDLVGKDGVSVCAIGVSTAPEYRQGSYMPCFLAGQMAAKTAAVLAGVPLFCFSHQAGHIAAAAFGAHRLDLLQAPFLAFHVSGGTTRCVRVQPDPEQIVVTQPVSESLDLHAGQVIDRVGAMLGLPFPAGPALEQLAMQSDQNNRPKPAMKGGNCCLSGLQNICQKMQDDGAPPPDIARYCLCYIRETLLEMTGAAVKQHPALPLLFAGGVMSNQFLQKEIAGYFQAIFAPPAFSVDNAAGTAVLTALRYEKEGAR